MQLLEILDKLWPYASVLMSYAILLGIIVSQHFTIFRERRIFNRQRTQLLNRLMARDLPELAQTAQYIDQEPDDDLNKIRAENDLAIRAEKIIADRQGFGAGGFPVV